MQYSGRVSAILELGMGFHPDLTGRENVYHSAGLMGFTPAQISEKIDEIEAFAEIGEYFDEPVRVYSSVLLPAPFLPTIPTDSPLATQNEIPFNT